MARQTIELGRPFTIVCPDTGEKEFYVKNLTDSPFNELRCSITNSTSYAPPKAFVTDKTNKIIKLKGFAGIPPTTSLSILVQGEVFQQVIVNETHKTVLLSDEKLEAAKQVPKKGLLAIWKYIKWSIFFLIAGSFLLHLGQNTQVGKILNNFNAATGAKVLENFDLMIATNNHPLYETSAFMMLNAQHKEEFGDDQDLSKLYHFAGNVKSDRGMKTGVFVLRDVVRDQKGLPVMKTWNEADSRCEKMGGLILNKSGLKTYLAKQYAGVTNFIWPIQRHSSIREWTGDSHSGIPFFKTSWMFIKEDGVNPTDKEAKDGFVVAKNSEKGAFRCWFSETFYMAAE